MKIVVLAGGLSGERNVSLSSGTMVAEALREQGHRVALADLFSAWRITPGTLEDLYDAPYPGPVEAGGPGDSGSGAGAPARRTRVPAFSASGSSSCARPRILSFWPSTGTVARMAGSRRPWPCTASPTPGPTI